MSTHEPPRGRALLRALRDQQNGDTPPRGRALLRSLIEQERRPLAPPDATHVTVPPTLVYPTPAEALRIAGAEPVATDEAAPYAPGHAGGGNHGGAKPPDEPPPDSEPPTSKKPRRRR